MGGLNGAKAKGNDRSSLGTGSSLNTSIGSSSLYGGTSVSNTELDAALRAFEMRIGGLRQEIDQMHSQVKNQEDVLARMKAENVILRQPTLTCRKQDAVH